MRQRLCDERTSGQVQQRSLGAVRHPIRRCHHSPYPADHHLQATSDSHRSQEGLFKREIEPALRVTGHRLSNLGPGRVGSRVKARLSDPDS